MAGSRRGRAARRTWILLSRPSAGESTAAGLSLKVARAAAAPAAERALPRPGDGVPCRRGRVSLGCCPPGMPCPWLRQPALPLWDLWKLKLPGTAHLQRPAGRGVS